MIIVQILNQNIIFYRKSYEVLKLDEIIFKSLHEYCFTLFKTQ